VRTPIRSCSRWGLPSQPVPGLLVRSYRTVASLPVCRLRPTPSAVLISVALSLGLLPPDVIRHPALRSSDFPPVQSFDRAPAIAQLASTAWFSQYSVERPEAASPSLLENLDFAIHRDLCPFAATSHMPLEFAVVIRHPADF